MKKSLIIMLLLLSSTYCAKAPVAVKHGVVTFAMGEVFINSSKALPGDVIKKGDTLITAEKSSAVIQINRTGIIAVKEKTSLRFNELEVSGDSRNIEFILDEGFIFNRLMKSNGSYRIKTRSVLAAVRGTSFSVSSDQNRGSVKVLNGEVEVSHVFSGKALSVKEGESVSVCHDNMSNIEKLSVDDSLLHQKLDTIRLITSEKMDELISNKHIEVEVVPADVLPFLTDVKNEDPAPVDAKMTLGDLEKMYGPLSRVVLSSGKIYTGSFRQSGGSIEIITVDGKVKVPAASVSRVEPYK